MFGDFARKMVETSTAEMPATSRREVRGQLFLVGTQRARAPECGAHQLFTSVRAIIRALRDDAERVGWRDPEPRASGRATTLAINVDAGDEAPLNLLDDVAT